MKRCEFPTEEQVPVQSQGGARENVLAGSL